MDYWLVIFLDISKNKKHTSEKCNKKWKIREIKKSKLSIS